MPELSDTFTSQKKIRKPFQSLFSRCNNKSKYNEKWISSQQKMFQVLDEEESSPGGLLGRLGQARNGFTRCLYLDGKDEEENSDFGTKGVGWYHHM